VLFLGSTIGNLTPQGRKRFLTDLDATMSFQDRLLLGTDLVKDPRTLVAAYDDASGVTAAFNRNVLLVLNAELHATFDPATFEHRAVWNAEEEWIEMRLRSTVDQVVRIADLDLDIEFAAGEDLLTEISAKFRPERVERELWDAGFVVEKTWTNPEGEFQLTLARPYC
jgi:L-histidine N-alpha-methyltransferase